MHFVSAELKTSLTRSMLYKMHVKLVLLDSSMLCFHDGEVDFTIQSL